MITVTKETAVVLHEVNRTMRVASSGRWYGKEARAAWGNVGDLKEREKKS